MKIVKIKTILVLLAVLVLLTGCTSDELSPVNVSEDKDEQLVKVNNESNYTYNDVAPIVQETIDSIKSDNGLVTINKKQSYYEVEIDLENGNHYDIGKEYAEAVIEIFPDYIQLVEPYLYENINGVFNNLDNDYTVLYNRIDDIFPQIPADYADEIKGFADTISENDDGFIQDGILSYDEVILLNMIPEVLRCSQCSGAAVYGSKSDSGGTITGRVLEWDLGNDRQMSKAHAVVTYKNGNKSFVSCTVLGIMNALSVYNDDGVFMAILDAGTSEDYISNGKKAYTYEVRHAIEYMTNADDAAKYIVAQGKKMTFSNNIFITDKKTALVVENAVGKEGICTIRNTDTELMNTLKWNSKDAIGVVNGFVSKENCDNTTNSISNIVRWNELNQRLSAYKKVSKDDMKDILTVNDPNDDTICKLYSNNTFQMIIVDSSSDSIEIAFSDIGKEFPLKPKFIKVK